MKKNLFVSLFLLIVFNVLHSQNIVINELITSNSNVITDDDGSYEDWVELYNAGTESVSLLGYGLSDGSNPYKWVFPDYSIQPGEHLLVWCSNKDRSNPEQPLHTNFAISAGGETITLTHSDGTTVDQIPPVVIPQNHSYGRETDGSDTFVVFPIPTPGATNYYEEPEPVDEVSPPVFSVNSGFYTNGFSLTLSHLDPEVTIVYTLDGSEPKLENVGGVSYLYKNQYAEFPGQETGALLEGTYETLYYNNPIEIVDRSLSPNKIASISSTYNYIPSYIPLEPIYKATVVRARAVKNDFTSSVITNTYFITPEGAARFDLPVVSISIDEDGFYDYENGIYVAGVDFDQWRLANPDSDAFFAEANYKRSGSSTEKNANFSFFKEGNTILNQDIGLRINGGFTRNFPSKSLRLYARSEFGQSTFNHSFFEDIDATNFKRLILRNAGNDFYYAYLRDAFIANTVKHMKFNTQSYLPVVTFINGEYWGLLNMRERFDGKYFERVYNVAESDLDFLEYNGFLVQEGDYEHYESMLNFIQNNSFESSQNFLHLNTLMDIENYTDHYMVHIYVRNTDWPHNNIEFWRKRTAQYEPNAPYGQDGRWRWIVKDTDYGFGYEGGPQAYQHNTLAFATSVGGDEMTNPEWSTLIIRKLLENDNFKNYFINRFADMLNTTFLPDRVTGILDEMKTKIASEIPSHIERWGTIGSLQSWHNQTAIIAEFAHERPVYQRNHILEKFDIESTVNATLNVSDEAHGYIKFNTIEIRLETPGVSDTPYPWTGIYFKGIPVTATAIAKPGYVFSHWSGVSSSPSEETTFVPTSDFTLIAHFHPDPNFELPIYFWLADNTVPNDTPLTTFEASYEANNEAYIEYVSCLEGYPFNATHPNWRKASMERRNSPTDINYIPEANEDIAFEDANMRGIQIKQPFQHNGLENTLIFHTPTNGYKEIVLAFAAKDEGAAEGLIIDYNIAPEGNVWITDGLSTTNFNLTSGYELFRIDFSELESVNNNENFKVRVRFVGDNLTTENGDRITFNNFGVLGKSYDASIQDYNDFQVVVFPNPVADDLKVVYNYGEISYRLFSIDGKQIQNGRVENYQIAMSHLNPGIYFLVLEADGQSMTKKIIKK